MTAEARTPIPAIPERLERLNSDLTKGRKRFDHVNATHGEYRIRVLVERVARHPRHFVSDTDYRASAEFDGRRYFAYGSMPTHAYARVIDQLGWAVCKRDFELNMADMLRQSPTSSGPPLEEVATSAGV